MCWFIAARRRTDSDKLILTFVQHTDFVEVKVRLTNTSRSLSWLQILLCSAILFYFSIQFISSSAAMVVVFTSDHCFSIL